jgi:uncharacterized protein (TIGR02598 family)
VKHFNNARHSFSLVELTLALGVAAVCLISVFGLLPVGLKANHNALSQSASASVLAAVVADMRATPRAATISRQYGVSFGTATTLYFDNQGGFATSLGPNSRYRLSIEFPPNPTAGAATFAYLKVTWPAGASPATAIGASEVFVAFDRN